MLKKITGKLVTWTAFDEISPEALRSIEDMVRGLTIEPGVPFIKDNNVRSAFLLKPDRQGGLRLFVKWFKKPVALQRIRSLFVPSKALAEWRNLRILESHGLPCPRPLAFFEKRSFGMLEKACLVIEGLEGAQPLGAFDKSTLPASQKFELTRQLARLSAAMHAVGIYSRDYHAGNIMIRPSREQGFELFLIDMHKALARKKLRISMIITDLAKLSTSLTVSRTARLRFLREYYHQGNLSAVLSLAEFMRRINGRAARITNRHVLSRSKRCVLKSSVFEVARTWRERYCGRRDFGHAAAHALIAQHVGGDDQQTIVKKTSKLTLTTHALGSSETLCVKGFRGRGAVYVLLNLFRKSRALKSWVNANGLIVRGMLTPQPLAMIEKRRGPLVRENFYLCRWLDRAPELNDYITARQWVEPVKKEFIRCLAETIATLHSRGIYHGDLKSNNILVREKGKSWEFYYIDLDRISFSRPLTFKRRANNLAQLNASVADVMTPRDRLRFFRIYSRATVCYSKRKQYYKSILAISRTKNTIPYGLHFKK